MGTTVSLDNMGPARTVVRRSGETFEGNPLLLRVERPSKLPVALFNLKYSQNLGDGIIATCLERTLAHFGVEAVSIDLAGRTGFAKGSSHLRRRSILALLEALPVSARATLVPLTIRLVVELHYSRGWSRRLKGCRAAIIGGGALLADTDQNFPIKLAKALALISKAGLPVAIAHVGVTGGWSRAGLDRFSRAFGRADVISVSMRDPVSIDKWRALSPDLHQVEPHLALDPGILSAECFGRAQRPSRGQSRKRVGLCVTDPLVLRLHGRGKHNSKTLRAWYGALARLLHEGGYEVELFHNGSAEDASFLAEVLNALRGQQIARQAEVPSTPGELARYISTFDCVVAHRLHACIVAYSYGIPAVGLSWDKKVDSFFAVTGRGGMVVDWQATSPFELKAIVDSAIATPTDREKHATILDECRASIERLAHLLAEKAMAR